MPKKLTPIERAIAGESADRRKRYEAKMRAKGFTRVSVLVHEEDIPLVHELARRLREGDDTALDDLKKLLESYSRSCGGTERPQRSEDAPRPRQAQEALP